MNFIDLFAGAGGLSEGFIRAGFNPVAHVEMDRAACNTLLTRTAHHHLKGTPEFGKYIDYLKGGKIKRTDLYSLIPESKRNSVINLPIGDNTNAEIFKRIDELKGESKIDLIIGGPPCQAYSLPGRARDANKMKDDPRNYLFVQYAKYLEYYQPKMFVFENVVGLLTAKDKNGISYLQQMIELFREKGYETEYRKVEAREFGVLQNRKRIILIGRKGHKRGFYPEFSKWNPNITVSAILNDLKPLNAGQGEYHASYYISEVNEYLEKSYIRNGLEFTTQHIARPHTEQDKGIYLEAVEIWDNEKRRLDYNDIKHEWQTHKNRHSFVDRFKVVASDLSYSQTVVAHICKDGHYYIHPDKNQNRSLTPREAARLQTFPDDFYFEGINDKPSRTAAFKQIGNAVPVLVAEKIAEEILKIINL